jgi:chromosome segregation ATPase
MTPSRYIIARFAQAFGYYRRNLRMADAASEMHLLRAAEAQLGFEIWEKVEPIEELSIEYWNLRKFIKQKDIVVAKLQECQMRLDKSHEERIQALTISPEANQELLEQRDAMLKELEEMSVRRDSVVLEAREIRRFHDGLKMKLEVLTKESNDSNENAEEIAKVKNRLEELKTKFTELKQQRAQIAEDIKDGDARIDAIDVQLGEYKSNRRNHASDAFQVISDINKQMSALRAEAGLLDTQMRLLHAEIGRFVSRRAHQHEGCAIAAANHRSLIEIMRSLRRSVTLNHRLAGTN